MGDLGKRILSGAIGLILLIIVIFIGGIPLNIAIICLSLISLFELFRAINKIGFKPIYIVAYIATLLIYLRVSYADLTMNFIITLFIVLLLSLTVLLKNKNLIDVSLTLLGILYIPFLLSFLVYLDGTKFIWIIFSIAFGTDTFAYLIGSKIGKHKLCPTISPKKSVEGAIGGVIGSIIVTSIYCYIQGIGPWWSVLILSIIGSIASQLGDLTASRIKRYTGIKDFGKIMPGHGGMLDRFDSIIFASPVVYYYVAYFLM
ncbi:MAG: phosphatidate cytidylyltransferase [Gudongella sp.]|nr:phosphatidate cytidylyltransferase [Gudongella sp.]